METIVLIIHLVLAILLIGVVLLQRSEGGALGIGGGGGGLVSARGAATALSKITWMLAAGFLCTSLTLTLIASGGGPRSVFDQPGAVDPGAIPMPALPSEASDVPVPGGGDIPLPAAPAPAPAPAQ